MRSPSPKHSARHTGLLAGLAISLLAAALGGCGDDPFDLAASPDASTPAPYSDAGVDSVPVNTPPPPPPPPAQPDASAPSPDSAPANPCTGQGESFFNGHCYSTPGIKWLDYQAATALCAARSAKVATITSAAENDYVFKLLSALPIGAGQAAWIGLRRENGKFAWDDGTKVGYTAWAAGEPNNEKGRENCVVIWGGNLKVKALHARWNDAPCDTPGRDTVVCKRKAR